MINRRCCVICECDRNMSVHTDRQSFSFCSVYVVDKSLVFVFMQQTSQIMLYETINILSKRKKYSIKIRDTTTKFMVGLSINNNYQPFILLREQKINWIVAFVGILKRPIL